MSSVKTVVNRSKKKIVKASSPPDINSVAKELAYIFSLLDEEVRLKLLLILRSEKINVNGLCRRLRQSQPALSHHIAMLRNAGLIKGIREGKSVYYRPEWERCREAIPLLMGFLEWTIPKEGIKFGKFTLTDTSRKK